jgi:hypothetical protein
MGRVAAAQQRTRRQRPAAQQVVPKPRRKARQAPLALAVGDAVDGDQPVPD